MRKHTASTPYLVCALAVTLAALLQLLWFASPKPVDTPEVEVAEAPVQDNEQSERDEYISAWASSIDAYNAGYPLEGYGATFAAAAYDYGVDPRLSPAIARVESGSGLNCAYSCNAWGWGTQSWGDWVSAIYGHIAGLSAGYGTELTWDMAASYCPVGTDEWYAQVQGCMAQIG